MTRRNLEHLIEAIKESGPAGNIDPGMASDANIAIIRFQKNLINALEKRLSERTRSTAKKKAKQIPEEVGCVVKKTESKPEPKP